MSASRANLKTSAASKAAASRLPPLQEFVWEGRDKRGVVMKGEQTAKNVNLLRAELRRQGINPTVVKVKGKPLFGGSAKRIKPRDVAVFSRRARRSRRPDAVRHPHRPPVQPERRSRPLVPAGLRAVAHLRGHARRELRARVALQAQARRHLRIS